MAVNIFRANPVREDAPRLTKGGNQDSQEPRQRKRPRYVASACDECKRRKVKCDGNVPCQRCTEQGCECVYNRPPRPSSDASKEMENMSTQMAAMREQITNLDEAIAILKSQQENVAPVADLHEKEVQSAVLEPDTSPLLHCEKESPSYRGPTSSIFNVDIAKSSLRALGIETSTPEKVGSPLKHPVSSASSTNSEYGALMKSFLNDCLWEISCPRAMHLLQVYGSQSALMYPIFDFEHLRTRADTIFTVMASAHRTKSRAKLLLASEMISHRETLLLKLTLAIGLSIENAGEHELANRLVNSVKEFCCAPLWETASISSIQCLALLSLYYIQTDDEVRANRMVGIAARSCLEMGFNRRDVLQRNFPDQPTFNLVVTLFWIIYVLERRMSLGLGIPFIMQDRDVDPSIPEPDNASFYFRAMITLTRFSGKAWYLNSGIGKNASGYRQEDHDYLEYQILQWQKQIPELRQMDLLGPDIQSQYHEQGEYSFFLRVVLYIRVNQLRNLIYRPALRSASTISENNSHAHAAVNISKDTILVLSNLYLRTDLVTKNPILFQHFLISAWGVLLIAVTLAPSEFVPIIKNEYSLALDIMEGLSSKSEALMRTWKTVKTMRDIGSRLTLTLPQHPQVSEASTANADVNYHPSASRKQFQPDNSLLSEAGDSRDVGEPAPQGLNYMMNDLLDFNFSTLEGYESALWMGSNFAFGMHSPTRPPENQGELSTVLSNLWNEH